LLMNWRQSHGKFVCRNSDRITRIFLVRLWSKREHRSEDRKKWTKEKEKNGEEKLTLDEGCNQSVDSDMGRFEFGN
jgi:hypothetical protein